MPADQSSHCTDGSAPIETIGSGSRVPDDPDQPMVVASDFRSFGVERHIIDWIVRYGPCPY
jgi:hypothetical protein